MRFAELPIMLKQAREQCRVVQRELAAAELPPARSWSNKPKRSSGRSIATQTWSSGYTSPRPSSPRPSALPADASKPSLKKRQPLRRLRQVSPRGIECSSTLHSSLSTQVVSESFCHEAWHMFLNRLLSNVRFAFLSFLTAAVQ